MWGTNWLPVGKRNFNSGTICFAREKKVGKKLILEQFALPEKKKWKGLCSWNYHSINGFYNSYKLENKKLDSMAFNVGNMTIKTPVHVPVISNQISKAQNILVLSCKHYTSAVVGM